MLSNLISLVLFGLGFALFLIYFFWYGWNAVTASIPVIAVLSLTTLFLNRIGQTMVSRLWLILLVPVTAMAVSIFAKQLYYAQQEELDYFTFRFIILTSCVFPAVFFSFREKNWLIATSLLGLLILLLHDPLHARFGVPYRKDVLKESNYAFANIIVAISYGIMMGGVFFLKWTSERSEERTENLNRELNQINEELQEKNSEIEAQNQEIGAQTENLNLSQKRLQEAYALIQGQKDQLLRQNQNLSSELVAINQNLTTTNAELVKHNNELRQFSYTVSHNLRGPVASLLGLIDLMDPEDLNTENQEIYGHLKTSIKRLDTIISDLNKIIDIRHDIFHIRQKINLEKEVQEIVKGFRKDIDAHQVMIRTDFSQCPEIYSVKPMVHSILYNLVSNAIKYRALTRRPEIAISSSGSHSYILTVQDNGLGIDLASHKDNLFKLYKRFHYHTEGKGLGLYLVKLQAEALGGHVEVSSELNRSTTFTVYLGQPENVERQLLYEDSSAMIFFDARLDSVGVIWRGPLSSQQYRSVFEKCLDFVKAYHAPNYIADISQQGYIAREDQLWMFHKIMPEVARHGLKRIAAVKPATINETTQQYMDGISETLHNLGITQKFFSTFDESVYWIRLENEKTSASFEG